MHIYFYFMFLLIQQRFIVAKSYKVLNLLKKNNYLSSLVLISTGAFQVTNTPDWKG